MNLRKAVTAMFLWVSLLASTPTSGDGGRGGPVETQKLQASDGQTHHHFGWAIAVSGDILVAGAEFGESNGVVTGAAYVFDQLLDGTWIEAQKLVPSDGENADRFGVAVSLDGDTIVVGSPEDNDNGSVSGSAYVFERGPDGTWIEVVKLLASDGDNGDGFGEAVAVSEGVIVAGSDDHDHAAGGAGAAYVFERGADGSWIETQELLASDAAGNDDFGRAVGASGATLVVGADGVDTDGGSSAGAVYVYHPRPDGSWVEHQRLVASDGGSSDWLGSTVAVSDDYVIAGAPGDDDNGDGSGSAYVFERESSGRWFEAAKLLASDGEFRDEFGWSVAIAGETALVGAYRDSFGSAYIFERDVTGDWLEIEKLVASDGTNNDHFGWSTALSGASAFVGATQTRGPGGVQAGSVYVFAPEGCDLGMSVEPRVVAPGATLRVSLSLTHKRRRPSTVPLRLWIESSDGVAVLSKRTEPVTFEYGDTLERELTLSLPDTMPPGRYRVMIGVDEMKQGVAWGTAEFEVKR